jgi:hypothetical protein
MLGMESGVYGWGDVTGPKFSVFRICIASPCFLLCLWVFGVSVFLICFLSPHDIFTAFS